MRKGRSGRAPSGRISRSSIIDRNEKQLDGYTRDVCDVGDLRQKFEDFGWDAQEVDGHDIEAMKAAIKKAKQTSGKPHMIVLKTEKGKGCTFAEGVFYNHHIKFSAEQYEQAVAALDRQIAALQNGEA